MRTCTAVEEKLSSLEVALIEVRELVGVTPTMLSLEELVLKLVEEIKEDDRQ